MSVFSNIYIHVNKSLLYETGLPTEKQLHTLQGKTIVVHSEPTSAEKSPYQDSGCLQLNTPQQSVNVQWII